MNLNLTATAAHRRLAVALVLAVTAIASTLALPTIARPVAAGAASTSTVRLDGMSDRFSVGNQACLIVDDGRVVCWGAGGSGQLGYGNTTSISDAGIADNAVNGGFVQLPGGRAAVAISTGQSHTCAVLDNGQVTCWGEGALGRLGYANTDSIGDDETPAQNPVNGGVVPLPLGRTAVAVAAYFHSSCALLDNGQVACWGEGAFGALGYGNTDNIGDNETPLQNTSNGGFVPLPPGRTAVAIDGSSASPCVLLDNGQITCWGFGGNGRLGYGNTDNIGDNETPATNPENGGLVPLPAGRTAIALAGGSAHMCAVLDNGGLVCWGAANSAQLGYGNLDNIGDNETPATNPVNGGVVPLPAGRTAVGVAASTGHTCALLDNGQLSCWGTASDGRLGYGNQVIIGDDETPAANPVNNGIVPLLPGRRVAAMGLGPSSTCVVLTDGRLECWGQTINLPSNERVGDNETAAVALSLQLPQHHRVSQISAGAFSTCALFDAGTVSCWGSNANGVSGAFGIVGAIGDNERASGAGSVLLPGERTASAIAQEAIHACAVLDNGEVTCWGEGANGKLGYGNTNNIGDDETPAGNPVNGGLVVLPTSRTAIAVAVGLQHSCALLDNRQITCWGDAASGQLGYGNTNDIGDNDTPGANPTNNGFVPLPVGRSALAITAGSLHTCALLDNGQISCWGSQVFGQLGYGNSTSIGAIQTPAQNSVNDGVVPLPLGRSAVAVAAGAYHTCALLDNGQVACWGDGSFGKLGYGNTNTIGLGVTPASNPVNGGMVPLPAGRTAVSLAAGQDHTCVVLDNGQVACWGDAANGRLGYGNLTDIGDSEWPSNNPANGGAVPLPVGRTALSLSLSVNTTCAVLDDGSTSCWGSGSSGRLGFGNLNEIGDNETPAANPVKGGVVPNVQPVTRVDYRALQPARVLDTRAGRQTIDGLFQGGPARTAGSTLHLQVIGRGGVPLGSPSVTLTVAVVQPAIAGYLTIWSCGLPMPTASSLNFTAGVNTANTVVTATTGEVCIFTSQATDLIADVVGFTPRTTRYTPLTPARFLDTRPGQPTFDGLGSGPAPLAAGTFLAVSITGRGSPVALVAAGTRTVVLNVAAVKPAAGGFLTVWPCDQTQPNASNVNFANGVTTANLVVAQLSAAGFVCIFSSQTTNLIADVVGSFDQLSPLNPSVMRTFNPTRLVDTRPSGVTTDGRYRNSGALLANTTYPFQVSNRFPLAAANVAVLNVTAVLPSGNGFLTVWPCDQSLPNASSLNFIAGVSRANQVITRLSGSGQVCVRSSVPIQLLIDVSGASV